MNLSFFKIWIMLIYIGAEANILLISIAHLGKYFPPDVHPCMQGMHRRQQQRRDFSAIYVYIRNNRGTVVKKLTNGENIYKDRLYTKISVFNQGIYKKNVD